MLLCGGILSGFKFVRSRVDSLLLSGVVIKGGKARHFFISSILNVTVAITNCCNVFIVDVDILGSKGTSLFIENTFGNVSLEKIMVAKN